MGTYSERISFIPGKIKEILAHLEHAGFEAWIVGGAVRDMFSGVQAKDFDICTSATPDEVVKLFTSNEVFRQDFKVSDVDAKAFHVVIVNDVEIATFRKDIYENGELVRTEAVGSLHEDLGRRDLTINAMAMNLRGEIYDPCFGQMDLELGRIRFVGFGPDRINEDPCRIIRACRFVATIDGEFSDHTKESLIINNHLAANVAPERIRIEILKAMKYTDKPSRFFDALKQIGLLRYIFPDLHRCIGMDGGKYHGETVYKHCMLVGDAIETDDPMLRLVAFLHDIGKAKPNFVDAEIHFYDHHKIGAEMVAENLKRLRFTNKEVKFATNMISQHMRGAFNAGPKGIRKILRKFTELDIDWKDWLTLRIADRKGNLARKPFTEKTIQEAIEKFEHELNPKPSVKPAFKIADLAVSGKTIQQLLGIGPSEVIGAILQFLLDKCIAQPELNTRENLERLIIGKKGKRNA